MAERPRVLNEHDRIHSLPWVHRARATYQVINPDGGSSQTDFTRGRDFLDLIDSTPQSSDQQSVLLVGLGLYAKTVNCSYEPQKLFAHLTARKHNFQMKLVDIDPDVITDVRTRRTLYLNPRLGGPELTGELLNEWNKYLIDTEQNGRTIYTWENGLNIVGPQEIKRRTLEKGIRAAAVPQAFHNGIKSGKIRLIEADIATANLTGSQPFDFIEMENVFWILSNEGQQLAMANVAGHMKKGGQLSINELDNVENGGWLTDDKLYDLRLKRNNLQQGNNNRNGVVLTKI